MGERCRRSKPYEPYEKVGKDGVAGLSSTEVKPVAAVRLTSDLGLEIDQMRLWNNNAARTLSVWVMLTMPWMVAVGAFLWLEGAAARVRLTDVYWDYAVGLAWAFLLLAVIAFWPLPKRERAALLMLWSARIGVTLGFMLFYESYYGLDVSHYFGQGLIETDPWGRFGFGDGTFNMIGLAALHNGLIPESYHAMKVTWAMLGLIAVYCFYRAACLFLGYRDIRILYLLGLFPSILFWGSILGKDPITLLGIALYAFGVVGFFTHRKTWYLWPFVAGILLASSIRIWLGLIFVLPLGLFFVIGRQSWARRIVFGMLCVPIFVLAMQNFSDRFQVETAGELVERADQLSQGWSHGGSGQKIAQGFESVGDMVKFLPFGMFTALFRPLPGEVMNPFGLLAGAENALLLALLLWALYKGRWRRIKRQPVVAWAVAVVIVWSAIYGFVSFQNLGTAFRFKTQVMPILVLMLAYFASRRTVPVLRRVPVGMPPVVEPGRYPSG